MPPATAFRGLRKPVFLSVTQVLASAVAMFAVYRGMVVHVGLDAVGVWSVVSAAVLAGRVADFGIGTSITRFVAHAVGRGDRAEARTLVESGVVLLAGLVGLGVAVLYPLLVAVVTAFLTPQGAAEQGRLLLPWLAGGLVIASVSLALQGALDGVQRVDLRCWVVIGGSGVYLAAGLLLVRSHGLVGVALAQICQAGATAAAAWLLLRRQLPGLRVLPARLLWREVRALFLFGGKVQGLTLLALFGDPLSRMLVAQYGGLESAGRFELAGRFVLQARAFLIAVAQTLLPKFSALAASDRVGLRTLYRESYSFMSLVASAGLPALLVLGPVASWFWLGKLDSLFLSFFGLIALSWMVNAASGPAYFACLSIGHIRTNYVMHVVHSVLTLVGGVLLGGWWGGVGVVVAASVGLAAGSAFTIWSVHRPLRLWPERLLPHGSALLGASVVMWLGLATIATVVPASGRGSAVAWTAATIAGVGAVILAARHHEGWAVIRSFMLGGSD